jgi:D-aspartate ligase
VIDGPPAIVVGGGITALSVARSLHAAGISVYVLDRPQSPARPSRAVTQFVDVGTDHPQERTLEWLLSCNLGAVILAGADEGLELIARHRAELVGHGHHPVEANDEVLLAMLNKLRTYELALEHGVLAPKVVRLSDEEGLEAAVARLNFPCVLKPDQSHLFARRAASGAKVLVVNDSTELRREYARLAALGVEMFVTEVIYGESDEFVSYYGYLDEHRESLVHFTKRKIRQCPPGFGIGTYHETTHDPEVAAAGLRFFQAVGLRGLGNVEFKRDSRTGVLVLIECNPRFTLSNEVARAAGVDLATLCYNRALGRPAERIEGYRAGVHLWDPVRDLRALPAYRRAGELSTLAWSRSLMHRQVFPTFRLDDPLPAVVRARSMLTHRDQETAARPAPSTGSRPRRDASTRAAAADRALERLARGRGRRGRAVAARLDLTNACGVGPLIRRVRAERRLAGLGAGARDRLYEDIWMGAAAQCGARLERLGPGLLELYSNGTRTRVFHQLVPLDDPVTLQVALDKAVVHRLMGDARVPHADYVEWTADTPGPAASFLASAGGPCVVKPAAGTGGGHGVVPGVESLEDLRRARWHAGTQVDRLLIERQITGAVYRILLLDGELLDVVRSVPANVTGDGHSTIEELIAQENERRLLAGGTAGLSLIGLNLDTLLTLRRAGCTLSSVLPEGRYLALRVATNNNAARDNETWRGPVSVSVLEQARAAADAVGLRLAGIDVVTTDISRSLSETGGVISEVNGGPGLHHHYLVADAPNVTPVAVPILQRLLARSPQSDVRVEHLPPAA